MKIICDIKFDIPLSEEKSVLEKFRLIRDTLVEEDITPPKWVLSKGNDTNKKNSTSFSVVMHFNSDKEYDEWVMRGTRIEKVRVSLEELRKYIHSKHFSEVIKI